MALNPTTLGTAIATAFLEAQNGSLPSPEESRVRELASKIANAIHAFVLSGDVNTTVSTAVSTTVAAPIPVQVVPATGTGATIAPGVGAGSGSGSGVGKMT